MRYFIHDISTKPLIVCRLTIWTSCHNTMDNVSHLQAIHNIVYSQLGLMSLDGKDLHLEENDPRRKKNCNI